MDRGWDTQPCEEAKALPLMTPASRARPRQGAGGVGSEERGREGALGAFDPGWKKKRPSAWGRDGRSGTREINPCETSGREGKA